MMDLCASCEERGDNYYYDSDGNTVYRCVVGCPYELPDPDYKFNVDEEEIREIIKENKVDTTWSVAMDMADKIYELSGDKELAEQYRDLYHKLYWEEEERAREARDKELDFFCGRHKFYPGEC